jgi:hypothetical protein
MNFCIRENDRMVYISEKLFLKSEDISRFGKAFAKAYHEVK